ncbi:MAG: hypothetical protein DWP97_11440 [Calditrichaeota bacterium]|nr:MAG: hypothetical protein DWP97_11440 [Calditrichota bacterium]
MKTAKIVLLSATVIFLLSFTAFAADNSGRIYGKITTVDGDVFEGLIRWDKNEASWVDVLNGSKELPKKNRKYSDRKRYKDRDRDGSIELFGIKIGGSSSYSFSNSAQSGIRFGHIKSFEVLSDDDLLLTLKSGEEVELSNGSTDIGTDIREIVIEDDSEGEIELTWEDIETIEFSSARTNESSNLGERLYGTVTTRRGDELVGYVCWDIDEVLTSDILDGDEKNRSRKVRFDKIASIERYSSNGAVVHTKRGDEMLLRGSNDVDDSNRGIIVSDNGFGQVTVPWDEFDKVVFSEPRSQVTYDDFDGGKRLEGTVYTEDGDEYSGLIRWDNDEEYTWELLNGEYHDLEYEIEFGKIKSIEKKSYRSSIVITRDGREFRLRGSNDVDEDNKGIFIRMDDGDEVLVDWEDFAKLELK